MNSRGICIALGLTVVATVFLPLQWAAAGNAVSTSVVDRYGDALPKGAILRWGTVRWSHWRTHRATAFHPNGKILATAHDGGEIRLWEFSSGRPIGSFQPHSGRSPGIRDIAFTDGGNTLISATYGDAIRFWRLPRADHLLAGNVEHVARELPDRAFDAGKRIDQVAFSNDRNRIAVRLRGTDEDFQVWNADSGKSLFILHHPTPATSIIFTPDGNDIYTLADDGHVRCWDAGTGKLKQSRTEMKTTGKTLVMSPDGRYLAATRGAFVIWDLTSGKPLHLPKFADCPSAEVALSPEGSRVAVLPIDARQQTQPGFVFDLADGKKLSDLPHPFRTWWRPKWSPDGKHLALTGPSVWNVDKGTLQTHTSSRITSFDVAHDGHSVVIGLENGELRSWRLDTDETGRVDISRPDNVGRGPWPIESVRLTPDGQLRAFGVYFFYMWDEKGVCSFRRIPRGLGQRTGCAFSHDGRWFASAHIGQPKATIHLYRQTDEKPNHELPGDGRLQAMMAFSPNGKHFVSCQGSKLNVWDVESGKLAHTYDCDGKHVLSFRHSLDGRYIAVAIGQNGLVLIDTFQEKIIRRMTRSAKGQFDPQPVVAVSPDGRLVACACKHGPIGIWEMYGSHRLVTLTGHEGPIMQMKFLSDGRLVSASYDRTMLVWDIRSRSLADPIVSRPELDRTEVERLWELLGDIKTEDAYPAMLALVHHPQQAVEYISAQADPTPDERVQELITQLDADRFHEREAAQKELAKAGTAIHAPLRAALEHSKSTEHRWRIEKLLAPPEDPKAIAHIKSEAEANLRRGPRVELMLDWIGNEQARQAKTAIVAAIEISQRDLKAAIDAEEAYRLKLEQQRRRRVFPREFIPD